MGNRQECHLGHGLGDAEHLGDLGLVGQVERGPGGSEPTRAGGELEAPHTGHDRTEVAGGLCGVWAVEPHGEHEEGNLGQMVDEEFARLDHAFLPAARRDGLGIGPQVRSADLGVDLADLRLELGVVDDHPAVALEIATHGGGLGDVDAIEHELDVDGPLEVEAFANLLGGGQQAIGLGRIKFRSVEFGHAPSSIRRASVARRSSTLRMRAVWPMHPTRHILPA